MNIDLQTLMLLDCIVTSGSFAAGARASGLDPSAVSRTIAALERQLGFRLFERSTRRIALTEAGRHYHARVAPLVADLLAATESARDLVEAPRGLLRISASIAFGQNFVLPMLAGFRAANPGVAVQLILSDDRVDLIRDGFDIALRLSPDAPPDTVISRLMASRYRVVVSPAYLARHPLVHPADLAAHDCLCFPLEGYRDLWRFRHAARPQESHEVRVTGSVQIGGGLALRQAARLGLGPALLADWTIGDDIRTGRLIDLFPDVEVTATSFETGVYIVTTSRRYQPLRLRRFIEALRAHARAAEMAPAPP